MTGLQVETYIPRKVAPAADDDDDDDKVTVLSKVKRALLHQACRE